MKVLKCMRCGHKWTPRTRNPLYCPYCKQPKWNRPRR